jgi:hypothetical protein
MTEFAAIYSHSRPFAANSMGFASESRKVIEPSPIEGQPPVWKAWFLAVPVEDEQLRV